MPHLKSTTEGPVRVVYFTAARILDELTIRTLGEELFAIVDKSEEDKIVLDFQAVQFMSSSALGMLIRFYKRCRESKARMKLCNISRDILEVFKITNLNKVFEIHRNQEEALAAFAE